MGERYLSWLDRLPDFCCAHRNPKDNCRECKTGHFAAPQVVKTPAKWTAYFKQHPDELMKLLAAKRFEVADDVRIGNSQGNIIRVNSDGTYLVETEDGDVVTLDGDDLVGNVAKTPGRSNRRNARANGGPFEVDDDVEINKPGDPNDGEVGIIVAIEDEATYVVKDEDGNALGSFDESELRAAARATRSMPDGYAAALPRLAHATDDKQYDPFGQPANSYAIALAAQRKEA